MKWISVKAALPPPREAVVGVDSRYPDDIRVCVFDDTHNAFIWDNPEEEATTVILHVTYWLPLPELPKIDD